RQFDTIWNWYTLYNMKASKVVAVHVYHLMRLSNRGKDAMRSLAKTLDLEQPHPVKFRYYLAEIVEHRTIENLKRVPLVSFYINFQNHVIAVGMPIFAK